MIKRIRSYYRNLTLARRIRFSYLMVQIPLVVLLIECLEMLWNVNSRYDDMIESAVVAGEFSLDFKKDFDDEAYLLIAGNKDEENTNLDSMLQDAIRVEYELLELSTSLNPKRK